MPQFNYHLRFPSILDGADFISTGCETGAELTVLVNTLLKRGCPASMIEISVLPERFTPDRPHNFLQGGIPEFNERSEAELLELEKAFSMPGPVRDVIRELRLRRLIDGCLKDSRQM